MQVQVQVQMRGHIHRAARALSSSAPRKNVVIVDGCRTPFSLASTLYKNDLAVDIGRIALKGLLTQTALDPNLIDYLLYGTVIQETRTSNIAREASLGAGIPKSVPAHTVTMACISSSQAICAGAEKIMAGQADIVVAGGVETFSDVPIRYSRPIRQRLLGLSKAMKKGPLGALGLLKGLKLKDLAPETPAIANYTTGEVMGHSSDRLAMKFGVSRREQDEFALRSHINAAKAHTAGLYKDEILPYNGTVEENGIKGDSTIEKLSSLKPAFIKPHGTHTAANSSFLSDGASAILIMSEDRAKELGYRPKSILRAFTFVAVDPFEELLLGPTYAVHKVLKQMNLSLKDMGVIEIHEAFAGQVLANIRAMASDKFAKESLGGADAIGDVDFTLLNTQGGSLAIGHPFGATGARLATTASNRLIRENKRFAVIAACADGGLAHACILERYDA